MAVGFASLALVACLFLAPDKASSADLRIKAIEQKTDDIKKLIAQLAPRESLVAETLKSQVEVLHQTIADLQREAERARSETEQAAVADNGIKWKTSSKKNESAFPGDPHAPIARDEGNSAGSDGFSAKVNLALLRLSRIAQEGQEAISATPITESRADTATLDDRGNILDRTATKIDSPREAPFTVTSHRFVIADTSKRKPWPPWCISY